MNTRNLPGGKERPGRRADNLTAICESRQNVEASTSHKHLSLHCLLQG
jgi:hypothetical protein